MSREDDYMRAHGEHASMFRAARRSERGHKFYNNCVNWPHNDVHAEGGLCSMIDAAVDISRATFVRNVDRADREELERQLGYAPHCRDSILTMTRDYHVSYHRSTLHGKRVYFFKHSAIEYVFTERGEP